MSDSDYAGYRKLVSKVLEVPEDDILPLRYDDIGMIDVALAGLGSRNAEILQRRFGLRGERQTLQSIAERFLVRRERIRQLEAKALDKLRHPSRIRNFLGFTNAELERQRQIDKTPLLERYVEHFELSVRTLDALDAAGVQTLMDLTTKTEREMLMMPNFGRKSLVELKNLLHGLDLDFAPDKRHRH